MAPIPRLAIFAGFLLASSPTIAQEPEHGAEPASHAAEAAHHEGGEPHGVINWWSWDYGPNAKDPAHKHWPPPFGFALINFAVFLAIMGRLAGKPLKALVRERHERIRHDLDEASRLRAEAERKLKEYSRKVENVEAEIEALLQQIRAEAEQEKVRIVAAAEAQAQRLKQDAQRQIEAELERARLELRRGVIEAAVAAAEQLVTKEIGADDQRRMAEKYVADVEAQSARRTA